MKSPPMRAAMFESWAADNPGFPLEHHVFLRMSHTGEPIGCFIRTYQIVYLCGHDWCQCISYDHHPQAVRERCTKDAGIHTCFRQNREKQNDKIAEKKN